MLYSLRYVLKIVLNKQKVYIIYCTTSERVDMYREARLIKLDNVCNGNKLNNVCNGNPTVNCHPFFF